ncbi:hypothetical protein M1328_05500 [Patescibacteria group bacterium]|nr:hypothetical protein [Patescibacteria group bacterium]
MLDAGIATEMTPFMPPVKSTEGVVKGGFTPLPRELLGASRPTEIKPAVVGSENRLTTKEPATSPEIEQLMAQILSQGEPKPTKHLAAKPEEMSVQKRKTLMDYLQNAWQSLKNYFKNLFT